jgi:hypothetical protein
MKKTILIILMTLFVGTVEAQHQQTSYVFASFKFTGATNVMASTAFSHPLEGYSTMLSGELEGFLFLNEAVALRVRGGIGYGPSNTEFGQTMVGGGAGVIVSTRDGAPYGFVELRPRWDLGGTTLAYSQSHSTFFVTTIIGVGLNRPITKQLWLSGEMGFSQNLTIHSTNEDILRDESSCFLTVGIRYLINYEGE